MRTPWPYQIEQVCKRKRRYSDWEDARRAGLLVSLENPRPKDANAPTPYLCEADGTRHYHYGHLRVPKTKRRSASADARTFSDRD